MSGTPLGRRVVAVVSSFRPTADLVRNVGSIAAQVDEVIVVDDGSGQDFAEVLDDVRAAGARVIALPDNVGIAAALNAGLDAAGLAAEDLAVTFDQDSAVPPGFVGALVKQWDAAVEAGLPVGMVSPERFAGVSQAAGHADARGFLRSVAPIQSGSLFSGRVIDRVGAMRAGLFIDLVDKEFYLRLRRGGFDCLVVPDLDLPHGLGQTYALTIAGRVIRPSAPLTFSMSAPFRYYYRVRNRVAVNREYRRSDARLLARDTLLEVRHLVLVWLSARDRAAFVRLVWRAWWDGVRRRTGRIPDDVAARAAAIRWRISPR